MANPVEQLAAVHEALAAVQDEAKALLQRPDDRKRLGQAALHAYADTGQGTQAGCLAAVADIAGVNALVGKYAALHQFPNARAVAIALQAAGPKLGRIVWTKPPPPPPRLPTLTLTGPGDIAPSPDAEVDATATVALSAPADHDVTAEYAITGQQFGDLLNPDVGPVTVPAGQGAAPVTVRVAPLTLTADRPLSLALSAVVGAAPPFPAPAVFRLLRNSTPPKGRVSFAEDVGQVARKADAEVLRMVKVVRDGVSTRDPARAPVTVSGLPGGVVQASPADFPAGSRFGYAPLRFSASAPARAPRAAAPMTGTAALQPTETLDLGDKPTASITVLDPVVDPPTNDWAIAGGGPSARPWVSGWAMNWLPSDLPRYVGMLGHAVDVASGGSHSGGRTASWAAIAGGPLSGQKSAYDDAGVIPAGTQLAIRGTSLETAFRVVQPGKGYIVACWYSTPDGVTGAGWQALGSAGPHDDYRYALGRRAWAYVKAQGFRGWQLVVRWEKEWNQAPDAAARAPHYAKALARTIASFDQGYADGGGGKPRHVLGIARHDQLGPLEGLVPVGADGRALIDAIDISFHPASSLNVLVGKPFDQQVAAVREWIRGGYDSRPSYTHDHADPRYSGLVVARKHGIKISTFEWSPRNDPPLDCHVSAAAYQAIHDFFTEHADMLAGEGVYHPDTINTSLAVPGWADGVRKYCALWGAKS